MIFEKVLPEEISPTDLAWLAPIPGVRKASFAQMQEWVLAGLWDFLRIPEPAQGVAVVYPWEGRLFVHYLRGRDLFATLTTKDLLDLARSYGLHGVIAETQVKGIARILRGLGFKVESVAPGHWIAELQDGR